MSNSRIESAANFAAGAVASGFLAAGFMATKAADFAMNWVIPETPRTNFPVFSSIVALGCAGIATICTHGAVRDGLLAIREKSEK